MSLFSLSSTSLSLLSQSNSQLLSEILIVSSNLQNLISNNNELQLLSLGSQNSLFAFNPQLLQFSSGCGSCLNQLLEVAQLEQQGLEAELLGLQLSSVVNGCLGQLLQLELLASGSGNSGLNNVNLGNGINNNDLLNNSSSASNVTVDSSANATAVADPNAANATANATADASATATADAKADKKKAKSGKRDEVAKRSSGEKLRILTGMGLTLVFGAAVLSL
jgi:hypothetical protein